MNLEYKDGLLFSNIEITHYGKMIQFPNVVIDTGAAQSILSIDVAQGLFNAYEPGDQILFMNGIGGREAAVRRKIHEVGFHSFRVVNFSIDFGRIDTDDKIDGLIGLDILIPGGFIVDLYRLEIYSNPI